MTSHGALARAAAINTSLWGGKYNPIVPVLARRPAWWRDVPWPDLTGPQLTRSYLEAWDPDVLVNMVPGYVVPDAFADREVSATDLSSDARDIRRHMGVDCVDVYAHLHQHERRFVLRRPDDLVLPTAGPARLDDLVKVWYGHFDHAETEQAYMSLLEAERHEIHDEQLWNGTLGGPGSFRGPLSVGSYGIEVTPSPMARTIIYIFDADSPWDLLDLWNLRATGDEVLPLPRHAVPTLAPRLAALTAHLTDAQRFHVDLVPSRRWTLAESKQVVDDVLAHGVKGSFGQIAAHWHHDSVAFDAFRPVSAGDAPVEIAATSERATFQLASPTFADSIAFGGWWINVLTVRKSYLWDEGASIFPRELQSVRAVMDAFLTPNIRTNWEGIVVPARQRDDSFFARLPTGQQVIEQLLSDEGFQTSLSEPGRMTLEMIRRVGGLADVRFLRNRSLINLFQDVARSEVMQIPPQRLDQALKTDNKGRDGLDADRVRRALTDRGILRAGLTIRCPHCQFGNWYSPEDLSDIQRCAECLQTFPFPQERPPGRWAYQTTGGFRARRQSAVGRYPVMLALHALYRLTDSELDWSTSLNVGDIGEVDFIALHRARNLEPTNQPHEMVFGEVKTRHPLQPRDFERAQAIQRRFPRAILVFATLDEEGFTAAERDELSRLARPASLVDGLYPMRAQLILLTPDELYSDDLRAMVAADLSDAPFAQAGFRRALLPTLAEWSQKRHLGLGDFFDWRQEIGRKPRLARLQRSQRAGRRAVKPTT
ncbi:hypothetical protein DSM104299_01144 [Baekduia alba]|uniref:hypothetical protein n=1 Tax=Baekduia alba TaxID=2997333 RepID=UPI00233F85FF|nr:hypothetical protein [Baekduia alba]WCB92448.1 hypothetical protein DSM104299_01144 [Baekduia alba]